MLTSNVRDRIDQARAALAMAGSTLPRSDLPLPQGPLDPSEVTNALIAAEEALRRDLRSPSTPAGRRPHLAVALVHCERARAAVREAESNARTANNRRLIALLESLRPAATVHELIEAVPKALGDLGYDRVLLSQLSEGKWVPLSSYVRDNPGQAMAMNTITRSVARLVDPRLVEYEMLAAKKPIIVLDAKNNGRVHPELLALTDVRSYAGAPIVMDTGVAGFVHADCTDSGRTADPSDAMLLATVGEVLAFAFERAVLSRRLRRISDLVREPDEELVFRIEQAREADPGIAFPTSRAVPDGLSTGRPLSPRLRHLSQRELEVLRLLAKGASNMSIAIQMGIAETTVKTHVKHVIRKSGVANRAEAVALYLRPPG